MSKTKSKGKTTPTSYRWYGPDALQRGAPKPAEVRHNGWFTVEYGGALRWTNGAVLHMTETKPLVRLYPKDVIKRAVVTIPAHVTTPAPALALTLAGVCEGHYRAALFARPDGRVVQINEAYVRYWRRLGDVQFVGATDIYDPIGVQLNGQSIGLVMGLSPDPWLKTIEDLHRYISASAKD